MFIQLDAFFKSAHFTIFSVCIITRISSLVPLMSAFLQLFKSVKVSNISVSIFSILVDIVMLLSLNLYINVSGGYLSTKLVYSNEVLLSINTGFKVVNWIKSCILKTIKMSLTDSFSYIFFSSVWSGFHKNSIKTSFKKIFTGDPSSFLNTSVNVFSPVYLFFNWKKNCCHFFHTLL